MVTDEPFMTREEAAIYTDLMPDGKARSFTFVMEAKSVITRPSGEHVLEGRGWYEISGLAWSGLGQVRSSMSLRFRRRRHDFRCRGGGTGAR